MDRRCSDSARSGSRSGTIIGVDAIEGPELRFTALLWEHPGQGAWHFVTLPDDCGDHIRALSEGGLRRGFGSVRVQATLGPTTWSTSVFPDKESGSYVLPVKRAVRAAADAVAGDRVDVRLRVVSSPA